MNNFELLLKGIVKPEITESATLEGIQGCSRLGNGRREIAMLPKSRFETEEEYYCVLFHELIHFTRTYEAQDLSANHSTAFDCSALEEVIAEVGAMYLGQWCGISDECENRLAGYIAMFAKKLEMDVNEAIEAVKVTVIKAIRSLLGSEITFNFANTPSTFINENVALGKEIAAQMPILA